MKYSIYKEDKPQNTINKIKKILKNIGIEVKEFYFTKNELQNKPSFPIYSLRLEMINPRIGGTNGKGTSLLNAQASAYAEFIERLQNFILFDTPWLVANSPDRFAQSSSKNIETIPFFQKKINNPICSRYRDDKDYIFLPFYSIKDEKTYNLPYDIIMYTQGSNGMAAGNTIEEATVQGLSEICERYAIKKIFFERKSIPDIPEQEYIKYSKIKQILSLYKKKGYNVYIKDASLNAKIPVVCTIFEKDGIYNIIFGSQPSLPIAIERTLTEFAQNNNLDNHIEDVRNLPYYSKIKFEYSPIEHVVRSMFYTRVSFEMNDLIKDCFFNNKTTYKYSKNAWIQENKEIDNKSLLDFLVKKISLISSDIYIRNVSFLGFNTIYIFIPDMSLINDWTKTNYEQIININNWLELNKNKKDEQLYTIDSLLRLADYYMTLHNYWSMFKQLSDAPPEYIAFLCSIVLKDKNKMKKYREIMFAQNRIYDDYTDEQIKMVNIIYEYFDYKNKCHSEKEIRTKLNQKYSEQDIRENIRIAKKLKFETIVKIAINKLKKRKINTKRLINRIMKEYIKNSPNQQDLKIFYNNYNKYFNKKE